MKNTILVVVKGIIIHNNKFLIVKRDDNDEIGAGTWEFVGGKIEFGEGLEDALKREVKEEVGIDIMVEKLLYATTFNTDPTRQVVILAYKCGTKDNEVVLSNEHSNYKWASKDELRDILYSGILYDMDKYDVFSLI